MTCLETQSKKGPFFLPGSYTEALLVSHSTVLPPQVCKSEQASPATSPSLSLWPQYSVRSLSWRRLSWTTTPTKDSLVFAAFTLATSFCTQVTSPFLTARIRSCSRPILTTGPGSGLQSPGRRKGPARLSVSSPCLSALEDPRSWGNQSGVSSNGLLVRQRSSPSRCSGSCHHRQESQSLVGWRLCGNLA